MPFLLKLLCCLYAGRSAGGFTSRSRSCLDFCLEGEAELSELMGLARLEYLFECREEDEEEDEDEEVYEEPDSDDSFDLENLVGSLFLLVWGGLS